MVRLARHYTNDWLVVRLQLHWRRNSLDGCDSLDRCSSLDRCNSVHWRRRCAVKNSVREKIDIRVIDVRAYIDVIVWFCGVNDVPSWWSRRC
jgi:hypothetical protein